MARRGQDTMTRGSEHGALSFGGVLCPRVCVCMSSTLYFCSTGDSPEKLFSIPSLHAWAHQTKILACTERPHRRPETTATRTRTWRPNTRPSGKAGKTKNCFAHSTMARDHCHTDADMATKYSTVREGRGDKKCFAHTRDKNCFAPTSYCINNGSKQRARPKGVNLKVR